MVGALSGTVLANVDLSTAHLENVKHLGPSILDHRTLNVRDACPWPSYAAAACPTGADRLSALVA